MLIWGKWAAAWVGDWACLRQGARLAGGAWEGRARPSPAPSIQRPLKHGRGIHFLLPPNTRRHYLQKQAEFDKFDLADLRQQVLRVQAACEAVGSPAVFAHNDLLAGNVMVADALWADLAAAPLQAPDGKDSLMTFIDFEYADWAPRGFDWGNHFNEYVFGWGGGGGDARAGGGGVLGSAWTQIGQHGVGAA